MELEDRDGKLYSEVYNNNGMFMVDITYISKIKLTPEEEQKLIDAGLLATMKDMNIIKKKMFKEWFENKLTIGGFPHKVNKHFDYLDYDVVINVSDEWYPCSYSDVYWFPMNEVKKDIGLNSIYGAMVILDYAEKANMSVYLHCHMGVNRSEIVRAAYYFMRSGNHLVTNKGGALNVLVDACNRGYLPPKDEVEKFLGKIAIYSKNMQGGILDMCKIESLK